MRPAGVAALERYLAAEIKGVGPALARRIAAHFGDTLAAVLDSAPERLHEVRGLPRLVAQRIAIAWRDSSGLRELTVFLRGHGIGAAHARRIHKVYGQDSLETIRDDPYLLARTVAGIGFRTADRVAEKLGIPRNSIQRARAATLYLLERMADEGHVFAPAGQLEAQFQTALEMDPALVREALDDLVQSGEVVVEHAPEYDGVYLKRLHEAESTVADRIRVLAAGQPMGAATVTRALQAAAQASAGFELTPEQRQALSFALRSRVTVITGGPGTGKTTLLRSLLAALDAAGLKPTLAAPTGRAARRLADATGREARTLHRLLEYSPETQTFLRGETFPLRTNYLVVDEASMMDIELAASVLRALMANSSLLLVGDRDQLPSVGPGSVLKDVITFGAGAGGAVARGFPAGAPQSDRRQCPSAESRRDAREPSTTRRATSSSSNATRPTTCVATDQAARATSAGRAFRYHRPARHPGVDADEPRPARRPDAQPRIAGAAQSARARVAGG